MSVAALKPTALVIQRGRTFSQVVRWETEPFRFSKIETIENVAPVRVTTDVAHGIPDGWRVAIVDARGLTELNAEASPPASGDFRRATVSGPSTFEFNPLSAAEFGKHKPSTGYVQWYTPHPLLGYVARMDIKPSVEGETLLTLSTSNGRIEIDAQEMTIALRLESADTATLDWATPMVFDLELESPSGEVTAVLAGTVSLAAEITTTT